MKRTGEFGIKKIRRNIENAKSAERRPCMQLTECASKSKIKINYKFTFRSCYNNYKFQKNKMDKSKHITCKRCGKLAPHDAHGMCK
jgi:hypothetical protein